MTDTITPEQQAQADSLPPLHYTASGRLHYTVKAEPKPIEPLIHCHNAAEMLGVGSRTVRKLTRDGHLPCVWIYDDPMYRPADVRAFVAAGGTPAPHRKNRA